MALTPNQIRRRIERCYYWTPLSYEECFERHTGLRSGSDGGEAQRLSVMGPQTTVVPIGQGPSVVDKEAMIRVAMFFGFVAVFIAIAYGVSKLIPD